MNYSTYEKAIESVKWENFFTSLPDFTLYTPSFPRLDATLDLQHYKKKPSSDSTGFSGLFFGLDMSIPKGLRPVVSVKII